MRLEIRNIGKVRHADIAIDGITVIAAANNTGKSTLGKALYSLLSPFHNYDSNVRDRLVRSVFSGDVSDGSYCDKRFTFLYWCVFGGNGE